MLADDSHTIGAAVDHADRDRRHPGADRKLFRAAGAMTDDFTDELVAEHDVAIHVVERAAGRVVDPHLRVIHEMHVRRADRGAQRSQQQLAGTGNRVGDLTDTEPPVAQHHRTHPHTTSVLKVFEYSRYHLDNLSFTLGTAQEGSQDIPPSAPTTRVLDVVELLAGPGNERLRFSDVARKLGLTQATTHAILTTLCARGWASRDPVDKTFSLGPALAAVAGRIDIARPLAHTARAATLQLAEEFGYAASVVERFGDSLVITAFEDAGQQSGGAPGDRIRYAPPFGVAFAAWDTDEEQRAWIQRGAATNSALAARLEAVLAHTRDRGFAVDCPTPPLPRRARG